MENQPQKKWYQKKGNIVAMVILGIIVIIGLSNNGSAQNQVESMNANTQGYAQLQPLTAPSYAVFHTTMSLGSSGTAVANIQQFLNDEGLYYGPDNGIFDQKTNDAVMAFERQENLTPINGTFGYQEQVRANTIISAHPDWVTTLSNNNTYSNVNGSTVQSPAYSSNGVPAGASAQCEDGTYSFSMHRSGTCSHHGGVSEWLY